MSREIDALIAEHVFNLNVMRREVVTIDGGLCGVDSLPWMPGVETPRRGVMTWVIPGGPGDYQELPRFSSTWEGMGRVVEAMHGRGWWCRITSPFSAKDGDLWGGGLTPHETTGWNGRPDHTGSGASAPEAVARAALAALRVPLPEGVTDER